MRPGVSPAAATALPRQNTAGSEHLRCPSQPTPCGYKGLTRGVPLRSPTTPSLTLGVRGPRPAPSAYRLAVRRLPGGGQPSGRTGTEVPEAPPRPPPRRQWRGSPWGLSLRGAEPPLARPRCSTSRRLVTSNGVTSQLPGKVEHTGRPWLRAPSLAPLAKKTPPARPATNAEGPAYSAVLCFAWRPGAGSSRPSTAATCSSRAAGRWTGSSAP